MKNKIENKYVKKIFFILSLCIVAARLYPAAAQLPELSHAISAHTPLSRAFPGLVGKLPHVSFGDFFTPIQHLKSLGDKLRLHNVYIKRDDLSGMQLADGSRRFGGNKVRKLEFLLADALNLGAQTVLTFGCAGSNHVVATAMYAQFLGLHCIGMLKPQPNSPVVQRNLLLMSSARAELYYTSHEERPRATELAVTAHQKNHGDMPYQIPTGGSCPLGAVGFVNAIFELSEQIQCGDISEPDYIYVAAGSCGTIAGLALGARSAGLHTKIVGVCVEPEEFEGEFREKIDRLFVQTNELLHQLDKNFPLFAIEQDVILLVHDQCGTGYGVCTDAAQEAIELVASSEQIQLDGTYTAKAFSALVRDARENRLPDSAVVLFWNSYCGDVIGSLYSHLDYHQLPEALWAYFKN